jgi:hypothetical protein
MGIWRFFQCWTIFKLRIDKYKKSELVVVKKFKDLPKFDFSPFKISIAHTFTTFTLMLILLLLYFNNLIPLDISHPIHLQTPFVFQRKKRLSLVLWKMYKTEF